MVSAMSASRYVTSASNYQSRSSMYMRGLIPLNSTELAEAVLIAIITLVDYYIDQPSALVNNIQKLTTYSQFKYAKLGEIHKMVEDGEVEDGGSIKPKMKIISPTPHRPRENEAYRKNLFLLLIHKKIY